LPEKFGTSAEIKKPPRHKVGTVYVLEMELPRSRETTFPFPASFTGPAGKGKVKNDPPVKPGRAFNHNQYFLTRHVGHLIMGATAQPAACSKARVVAGMWARAM